MRGRTGSPFASGELINGLFQYNTPHVVICRPNTPAPYPREVHHFRQLPYGTTAGGIIGCFRLSRRTLRCKASTGLRTSRPPRVREWGMAHGCCDGRMAEELLEGEARGKGGYGAAAIADGPDRMGESGAEHDREPSPSGCLLRAYRGGALNRSLCLTGHGCQARPLP